MSSEFVKLVQNLHEKSATLQAHLQVAAGRKIYEDEFIEGIHILLNDRQTIIEELENEAVRQNSKVKVLVDTFVPKELCGHLTIIEKEIADGLQVIFSNVKASRQLFQKKQRSRQQYRNPFASVERDGMFVDKRK